MAKAIRHGGYRLARCGGATRQRLLQVGDRTGHAITKALRDTYEAGGGAELPHHALRTLTPSDGGWVASFETKEGAADVEAATVVLAAGGRCFAEAETRGELSTNHPNATGEVTRIALDAGAQTRDLDALQYHPNGGAWPSTMQGYSIPETTRAYGAVLRNADGEEFTDSLGARDAVSAAIVAEVEKGKGVLTPDGRPAVWLDTTQHLPGGRRDLAPVHAPPVPRSRDRPARRADLHLPRPPLPERRPRDRRARGDDPRGRLRLRRDRRRHSRKESHDGQLAPRVRRLRTARRQGCRGEGARMTDAPPQLDPAKVQAFVSNAHGDLDGVQSLLAEEPRLVNAAWDWGGGDWETALGAAAHMGRRQTALFLLEHGARLDLFAAAMLGYFDIVSAVLSDFPEMHNALGPHGIPLVEHARAGGADARAVLELLEATEVSS